MGTIILPSPRLETPSKRWDTYASTRTRNDRDRAYDSSGDPSPSATHGIKDDRPDSTLSRRDDPSDVPTVMIYLGPRKLPSLPDVSDNSYSDVPVHEFKRGTFGFNARPRHNLANPIKGGSKKEGYLWKVANDFIGHINILRADGVEPPFEWITLTGVNEGDSVQSILKEYISAEQRQLSQDCLKWLEKAQPVTRLPDSALPLDDETIQRELEKYKGWTLASTDQPVASSRASSGASLWRINKPKQ